MDSAPTYSAHYSDATMAPDPPPAPIPPPPASYGQAPPARTAGSRSVAGPTGPSGSPTAPPQGRPALPRRVSSRRPIPPLILLVVLAVIALGVWFKVLQTEEARPAADDEACPTPPAVTALDTATIEVRVLNATPTEGLAAQVTAEFQGRGFVVTATDNDRSGRTVAGVGELRYGPRGAAQAAYTALFVPGITLTRDTRADALLDVVLGPEYAGLAANEAVAEALATPVTPTNLSCSSGDPSDSVDPTDTSVGTATQPTATS